jgi:hypothetical protein
MRVASDPLRTHFGYSLVAVSDQERVDEGGSPGWGQGQVGSARLSLRRIWCVLIYSVRQLAVNSVV